MSINAQETDAIRAVVTEAIRNGEADTITKRVVVKAVESRLGLRGGHFDKEQRNTDAYDAAEAEKASSATNAHSPARKSTSVIASSPPIAETKAKAKNKKAVMSDTDSGSDTPKTTKNLPQRKPNELATTKEAPVQKNRKRKSQDAFRTSEFINSEGDPIPASQAGVECSEGSSSGEQPKKKGKSTAKKDDKKTKPAPVKKAAARRSAANDDPDESELKKLKAFMAACEARQVWGRVFNKMELNDTKSQIRYLRQELKILGMPSRMSMEAAKKIGAKRALEKEARELGIDLDGAQLSKDGEEESEEQTKPSRMTARPKRAAALKRAPPKQLLRIDSDDDLDDAADEVEDSLSESEESDDEAGTDRADDDGSSSSGSSTADSTDDKAGEDAETSRMKLDRSNKSNKSKKTVERSSDSDSDL